MNNHAFNLRNTSIIKILAVLSLSVICGILSTFPMVLISSFLAIGVIILGVYILRKPDRFIYLLMVYVLLQNFFAIILSKYAGNTLAQGFILTKDILVYLALLIALIANYKKYKFIYPDLFAFLYLCVLGIYLVVPSDTSFFAKLVQFRQLTIPVILYLLGRFMVVNFERIKTFLKFLVHISVIAVLFGFLERYILGDNFWINLGIREFLASKGMGVWAFGQGGLPGNFYSYDFYSIIGTPLRRLVSFVADPTLFGQFLVFPIAILLFTKLFTKKLRSIYLFILLLGLLSTLSKGGMFSLGAVLTYKVLRSRYRPIGYFLLFVFVIITVFIINNASLFSSLPAHLNGFVHNIKLTISNPFGLGLGEAGNFARLFSENDNELLGAGESYFGMVLGQLGIFSVPFILFLFSLINFYRKKNIHNVHTKEFFILFAATLIGTVCSSVFSESAISFVSSGLLFLMSGVVATNKFNLKYELAEKK